jgi:DNA-binding transcriptional MerR regulator
MAGCKLRVEDVAKRTSYTVGTVRQYVSRGVLPPPRERIGNVTLFAAEDIRFYLQTRPKRKAKR